MEKILLTGCSAAEIPLINALHNRGYYVVTTGKNRDGMAHKYSDEYIYADYSNGEEIIEVVKNNNISNIVSGCSDFSYIATSYAAEKLGIKGHESYDNAVLIHNKDYFKNAIEKCGAYVPQNIVCNNEDEIIEACSNLGFPLIVKPIDLASGTGVTKCEDLQETLEACKKAFNVTRQSRIIIEQFIIGENHACSLFVKNNKVIFCFVDSEQYHYNKYMVAGAYSLCEYSNEIVNEIINPIEGLFEKYNLVDGLFHIQFIEKNNHPYIIDVCRRTPGELYGVLVSDSTGIDYYGNIVDFELGKEINDSLFIKTEKRYIARECIMDNKTGIYNGTLIPDSIAKYIYKTVNFHEKGELIENSLTFKAKVVFLECSSQEDLKTICSEFYKKVKIITE